MTTDRNSLIHELQQILPADSVLHTREDMRPYECDGLSAYRQLPLLVVLPTTVEQVQAILRLCHRLCVAHIVQRSTPAWYEFMLCPRVAIVGMISKPSSEIEMGVPLSVAKANMLAE